MKYVVASVSICANKHYEISGGWGEELRKDNSLLNYFEWYMYLLFEMNMKVT